MKQKRKVFVVSLLVVSVLLVAFLSISCSETLNLGAKSRKLNVVLVTGGHNFEAEPFFAMFNSFENITYIESKQKEQTDIFEDISNWNYDVIVLYNMNHNITDKQKRNFVKLLEEGVGVVALHHCIGAFRYWPEYKKIIGGKYYLKDSTEKERTEDGRVYPISSYKDGVDTEVEIANKNHPVTKGLKDFTINDETYKDCVYEDNNKVLATNDHPSGDKPIVWTRKYADAKICYIRLGHDKNAYAHPAYRKLVSNAIKWAAK
jgi:type 1 glutamine amidotransferase